MKRLPAHRLSSRHRQSRKPRPRSRRLRVGFEPLENRNLLAVGPQLLVDLNSNAFENPGPSVTVGGRAYLFADDLVHGRELWRTDGTVAGTALVKDVHPGVGHSSRAFSGDEIALAGDLIFFKADDGTHGQELWVSDGTEEGTVLVKDIYPGLAASSPADLTAIGDKLFFTATTADGGGLWTTDGTELGTTLVKQIAADELIAMGDLLFFTAKEDSGTALWKSDGTEAGTVRMRQIRPKGPFDNFVTVPSFSDPPMQWTVFDGSLLFAASDQTHGSELWRSDGTAEGTVMVADVAPGESSSGPNSFATLGTTLYFNATDDVHGTELWKLDDATGTPTLVSDINPGEPGSGPRGLVAAGDHLFFTAFNWTFGYELWKSDGTADGTVVVADIAPGWLNSYPTKVVALGSNVLFTADDASRGRELWRSDGTAAGTELVFETVAGTASGTEHVFDLSVSNGFALFGVGTKPFWPHPLLNIAPPSWSPPSGTALWRSDGTAMGTFALDLTGPRSSGSSSSKFAVVNDKVLFPAIDGVNPLGLWVTGGPDSSATLLLPGERSHFTSFTIINGFVFHFKGEDTTEFWKTDGTPQGTVRLRTGGPNPEDLQLLSAIGVGTGLFFTDDNRQDDLELWYSDGTVAGTRLIKDLRAFGESAEISGWADVDGRLIFSLVNAGEFSGIWKSDGTAEGTVLVKSSSSASVLASGQGVAYLQMSDAEHGEELWKSDGTESGTVLVKDIAVGPTSSSPVALATTEGGLYFTIAGVTLWRTDGTEDGTYRLGGLGGGGSPSYEFPTAVGEALFHVLVNADGTRTLCGATGDGAPSYVAGPFSYENRPLNLTSVNGKLYFTAGDDVHGRELWESDGTIAGTKLSTDIRPGPLSSDPQSLTSIKGTLYFSADDGIHGREPWTLQVAPRIVASPGTVGMRDTQVIAPFQTLVIAAEGPQTITVQITIDVPAKGAFTESSLAASGFVAAELGKYSFVGTSHAAQQAIRSLLFRPTENRLALGVTETAVFTVQVDDHLSAPVSTEVPVAVFNHGSQAIVAVFAPEAGEFLIQMRNNDGIVNHEFQYGPPGAGWLPLTGDWDGDGVDTPGLYDPATGRFLLRNNSSAGVADVIFQFGPGGEGWLPLFGDWDGDERDTVGLFHAVSSVFFLKNSNAAGAADVVFQYGSAGSGWLPIVGDWNYRLRDSVGLYVPETSTFFLRNENTAGPADLQYHYGPAGARWLPLAGDWDGDGGDSVGLYASASGAFYLRNQHATGRADEQFTHGPGGPGWLPVAGNWDGPAFALPDAPHNVDPARGENPGVSVTVGGYAYLFADDLVHGRELWKTDGTVAGTTLVKDVYAGPDHSTFPNLTASKVSRSEIVVIGSLMYFAARDRLHGDELWVSDGTESGTRLVADMFPGPGGSNPSGMTVVNGKLFFTGGSINGSGLWTSDGTEQGTVFVKEITPSNMTAVGDTLFFSAEGGLGTALWKSDGTPAGTVIVWEFPRDRTSDSYLTYLWEGPPIWITIDGMLLFVNTGGVHGAELWRSDGTAEGTVMVADLAPGDTSSAPNSFVTVGSTLYFTASDGVHGRELWKLQGAMGTPTLVRDIVPGTGSSSPADIVAAGDVLFFTAANETHGRELWKTDGTEAGTVLVADIAPGTADSSPARITALGSSVFFTADDRTHGRELWTSDGTAEGTKLVFEMAAGVDPDSGIYSQTVFDLSASNGFMLFGVGRKEPDYGGISPDILPRPNPSPLGTFLWRSDGTAAGTIPLDIRNRFPTAAEGRDQLFASDDLLEELLEP